MRVCSVDIVEEGAKCKGMGTWKTITDLVSLMETGSRFSSILGAHSF